MTKYMYDRIMEEYEKENKESLGQKIMTLNEIECNDRAFANQCEAGTAISDINNLFTVIDELQSKVAGDNFVELFKVAKNAKDSWNFIVDGLSDINEDSRYDIKLKDFKRRVNLAKESNANI